MTNWGFLDFETLKSLASVPVVGFAGVAATTMLHVESSEDSI